MEYLVDPLVFERGPWPLIGAEIEKELGGECEYRWKWYDEPQGREPLGLQYETGPKGFKYEVRLRIPVRFVHLTAYRGRKA